MNTLGLDPVLPLWIVAPPTVVLMLFLANHVTTLQQSTAPLRRRRIRTANGVAMMLTTALLAHALAIVSPADVRTFVLVWMMVVGLLGLIILLALLDAMTTYFLLRAHRQRATGALAHLTSPQLARLNPEVGPRDA
ncbi:MAG: hypothetical protein IH985_07610 [Planctomycetes bacterium]|nr:hypothetical protein [Planctomycetota bacterium]